MFSLLLLFFLAIAKASAYCVMYGECGNNPRDQAGPLNCFSSIQARRMDEQHTQLLQKYCPELVDESGIARTCCNRKQIQTLISKFKYIEKIRCASCQSNFRKYFCQLTCSPDQHKFVNVLETVPATEDFPGDNVVTEIEYYVSDTFAENFYLSCDSSFNEDKIIFEKLCSPLNGSRCTKQDFLSYMGGNELKPYIIKVIITNENVTIERKVFSPMNTSVDNRICAGCVWYGECSTDSGSLNCYDNSIARILPSDDMDFVKTICPELVLSKGISSTCCDANQLKTLMKTIKLPLATLTRCPACMRNLQNFACQIACSPYQNSFLRIQNLESDTQGTTVIKEVEYMVTESYAERLFASCSEVHNTLFSNKAMNYLCGNWGYEGCTAKRLLTNLGNNNQLPFLINVTFWPTEEVNKDGTLFFPLNVTTIPCSEAIDDNGFPCYCDECAELAC